jgi:hypothetical protein
MRKIRIASLVPLALVLLWGCAQTRTVPHFTETDSITQVADAEGWYHLGGLVFKGTLRNGLPDGFGTCRSSYFIDGSSKLIQAPCEFAGGARIDALHKLRMEQTVASIRENQRTSDSELRDIMNERDRRSDESARAFDEGMRANVASFNQQLAEAAATDRSIALQTQKLTAQAMREKQTTADIEADRLRSQRASREAREKEAAADLMRRSQGANTQIANSKPVASVPAVNAGKEVPVEKSAKTNSSVANTTTPASERAEPKKKKTEWGPLKLEMVAICRQSSKSGKWECNGALDNQTIVDEPTLESALSRQHCASGTSAPGGPIIQGLQWTAYTCGHSLGAGDYDVAKRYNLSTPRRSYICPKDQLGDGRCETLYAGQDKG